MKPEGDSQKLQVTRLQSGPEDDVIRVLIADSNDAVRRGLRSLLSSTRGIEVSGEATNFTETLSLLGTGTHDIALLDVAICGAPGLGMLEQIHIRKYPVAVIVMSTYEEARLVRRALDLGAAGYLSKRHVAEEVAEAIKTVSAGRVFVTRALLTPLKRIQAEGQS